MIFSFRLISLDKQAAEVKTDFNNLTRWTLNGEEKIDAHKMHDL